MSLKPNAPTWGLLSKYRNELYGLSILMIMFFHALNTFPILDKGGFLFAKFGWNGNFAVDGFLIMSGICLYFSMKDREKKAKTARAIIAGFYKKRFTRLLLLYFIFCIPFLAIKFAIDPNFSVNTLLNELNPISSKNSFWYLWFISFCYLSYPFLYQLLRKKKGDRIISIITIAYIVASTIAAFLSPEFAEANRFFGRVPAFLIGVILGERVYKNRKIRPITIALLFIYLVLLDPFIFSLRETAFISAPCVDLIMRPLGAIAALSIGLFISFFFDYIRPKKLSNILSFLGTHSLELYVTHVTAIILLPLLPLAIPQRYLFAIPYICLTYGLSLGLAVSLKMTIGQIIAHSAGRKRSAHD